MQKVKDLDSIGDPVNHDIVWMDNDLPGIGDSSESIKVGMVWKGRGSGLDRFVQLAGRNSVTVSDVVQDLPEFSASFGSPVNQHCAC